MLTKHAYAKINLTLDVVDKRSDGYHLLESVMQTVSLCDDVSVEKADKIALFCDNLSIPTDRKNTCIRAAELFFERTEISGGAQIILKKNIPSEAGLGGGSADAAAVLSLLNELYDTRLSYSELEKIAVKVGADVPFLIRGGCTVCRGIGEELEPLAGLPKRYVLLVKPDFGVSTPLAYKRLDEQNIPSAHGTERFCKALRCGGNPYEHLSNDLETALCDERIAAIRRELLNLGAEVSQMTGSGSCVFGLFLSLESAKTAKKHLQGYPFIELCETI